VSKYTKIIVATLMAVAMAAPAFADSKINGYFRNQFVMDNLGTVSSNQNSADKNTYSQIDQRLRIKYTNNLNEYVNFVYYGEVDTKWGQPSKGDGGGGQKGADGTNVETKNVYLDFKIPDSIFSIRTGIQGIADRFDYTFIADDWAAIAVNHKFAPNFDVTTIYSKGLEGVASEWDDLDLYVVQTNIKVSDDAKVMVDAYALDDNAAGEDLMYMVGAGTDIKAGGMGIKAWLAAQLGDDGNNDYTGLGASAKVTMNAGPAKVGVRATWFNSTDAGDLPWQGEIGGYGFPAENLMIFFCDKYYNNLNGGRRAMEAVKAGDGLLAINATADMKLPSDMYLNVGAGYFLADEDGVDGSDLGAEIAARIGTKVAEKVDVSLGGAYALVGDYYGSDSDDWYKVNFMFNVGF
jgi:hypothetical protein